MANLAANAASILRTGFGEPDVSALLSAKEIAERGLERWMKPRAERRPDYSDWKVEDLFELFGRPKLNSDQSTRRDAATGKAMRA